MNVSLFLYSDAESGETKVELNKVSISIEHYGVPDLAEVLGKRAPLNWETGLTFKTSASLLTNSLWRLIYLY